MEPTPVTTGKRLTALTRAAGYFALNLFVFFNQPDHNVITPPDSWESKMRAYLAYVRGNPQPLVDVQTYEASKAAPKTKRPERTPKDEQHP